MEVDDPRLDEELRHLQAELRGDPFEAISEALQDELITTWDEEKKRALREAIRLLRDRDGDFTRDDLQLVQQVLSDHLGAEFTNGVSETLQAGVEVSYQLGQETLDLGIRGSFNVRDRRAIRWLKDHNMYWVRSRYDRGVREGIQEIGQEALEEGLSRLDVVDRLQSRFAGKIDESRSYWELMANNVTTRSREFGRVEAFVKAGLDEVVLDVVHDAHTSCICNYLGSIDFRVPVEALVSQRDEMMSASAPTAVKEISPWLRCEQVQGKTADQLIEMGIVSPPYHGHCRSRFVIPD